MKPPVRVSVTGAAGNIGYAIAFRIAAGNMLGPDQPVVLQLLEITPALPALRGVVMELKDCAFPLLPGIVATTLFGFLLAWGDLLWAVTLASTDDVRMVTQGIAFAVGEFIVNWPMLTAAATMGSIPSVLLYVFMQRYLVEGITAGALKE